MIGSRPRCVHPDFFVSIITQKQLPIPRLWQERVQVAPGTRGPDSRRPTLQEVQASGQRNKRRGNRPGARDAAGLVPRAGEQDAKKPSGQPVPGQTDN